MFQGKRGMRLLARGSRRDSGPEPLRAAVADFLERTGLSRQLEAGRLNRIWAEVVGPELSHRTRVVGPLRGGVLRIEVDSPALLSELRGFESERLHQGMRERFKRTYIRKLNFQLGTWEKLTDGKEK